ncbi:RNA 2',3'-cyclic phosphodiesterase [Ketobacter sp.]|uniref:RNA 2',3'-cyclic phosphodiesterase n=1 Tax=Ketobacter sp. TaxID=2083498 RepID=UPI000F1D5F3D|nr:RNA 2',3'-cyclic phosphodiesterase [Ketobacter sp.]RLT93494.1 MAG: RNA 2',3'-cyclic phosphodiesterase [Ketobacter sp.]
MSEETIRCFLGVPLSPPLSAALDLRVQALSACAEAHSVRWVSAVNRHMTLLFLGDQPLAPALKLRAALQPVCASRPEFTLRSQVVSGFPDANSAIVALELESADGLQDWLTDIRSVLFGVDTLAGVLANERRYRPHVTLGRLPRGQRWPLPPQPCTLTLTVQSMVLYQSRLTPTGAQYTALWTLPLAAEA